LSDVVDASETISRRRAGRRRRTARRAHRGDGVEENRGADPQTNPATAKSRGGGSGAIRLRDMHTRKRVARSVDAAREPGDDAMACDAARNAPA